MTKKKTKARKKTTREKRKRGRPRKEIKLDVQQFEDMAAIGLTREEMAVLNDMTDVTLWKRLKESEEFVNALKRGRARLTASIRRACYDEGVNKRNITALIWISKNELGWSDRRELTGNKDKPIRVEHGLTSEQADAIKREVWGLPPEGQPDE